MSGQWRDRSVMVTGSDGFIGSHLVERLAREGARVRAFCLYNSLGSAGWLDGLAPELAPRVELFFGDIRDRERVAQACRGQEVVFHLASLIAIPYSYEAPRSYVDTNVTGALNVLEGAREAKVARVIHTSTSEVYGSAQQVPIPETHPLQGQSPYSASKIGADKMAESYFLSFGLPVTTVRPFNTYGPRQSARAVIPTILSQLLSGREEIRLGALHPTRDLNYVEDTVSGFLAAAHAPATIGRTLNIASGREISVGDLAKLLIEITGSRAQVVSTDERKRPDASEVTRLLGDASELRRLTGWAPEVSLRDGLTRTRDWMQSRLHLFRPAEYQR